MHLTFDQAVTAMSWFVAALGVLFAVGAIVAGFLLFRQSSDYRKAMAETLERWKKDSDEVVRQYRVIVDDYIAAKNAELETTRARLTDHIDSLSKRSTDATEEVKAQVAAEVARLQRTLAALPARVQLSGVTVDRSSAVASVLPSSEAKWYGGGAVELGGTVKLNVSRVCPHCGNTFELPLGAGIGPVVCPSCGELS